MKIKLFSLILSCISIAGFSQTSPPQKFHDTKGNIEVTKAGQLQYTLPIDVPPGVKKVAPNISLVYTSGGQNGLAGYGWNVAGLSSISRVGKNIEVDGITKGVQLDYSDYYSFGGQRLILKSGEYGKDGAEYVTEKYSNIKIKSIGSVTGQVWQGPEYWEVTFEDGSQAWYGATTPGGSLARTPIDYNIVKWKDAQGNYMTYNYGWQGNVSVINEIQWGGNENQNTPHFNKIEFAYTARPIPEIAYIKGVEFTQFKLLQSIIVTSNNQQYKKYNVSYKQDLQQTAYRYLDKITVLNGNNEEANPVVFTYEKSMDLPNPNIQTWREKTLTSHNYTEDLFGDFDGDGTLDLIKYHSSTATNTPQIGLYFYKNIYNGVNFNPPPIYIGNSISAADIKDAIAINFKKNNLIHNCQGFVTKKLVINPSTSKSDLHLSFYGISENNQLELNFTKVIPNADYDNSWGTLQDGVRTTVGELKNVDFNGDGLSEVVLQLTDKECYTSDPNDVPDPNFPPPHQCQSHMRYYVIDPDESIQNNGWYYPIELYPDYDSDIDVFTIYKAGDFNGDGVFDFLKTDQNKKPLLITFVKNSQGQYVSNLAYFNTNNEAFQGLVEDGVVGDYNGDGLSDVMMPHSNDSDLWYLYTSKGIGFKEETKTFEKPLKNRTITQDSNQNISVSNPKTFVAYDINNDGKAELIRLSSGRYYQKEYNQDDPNQGVKYRATRGTSVNVMSTFGGGGNPLFSDNTWGQIVYLNSSNINYVLAPSTSDMGGIPVDQLTGAMLRKFVLTSLVSTDQTGIYWHPYYDIAKEARISSITQGGITTAITYKQLDKINNPSLYDVTQTENYPYVQISQSTGMYVVSGITQSTMSNQVLKQDFRYRGLTSNILGRGMIGFRKTARSSWYADGFENTKIWSGVEIDPLNEGVPVKEWSIRTNNEANIFPADVSENNNQLLSFKSTTYQIDKILNGQVVTTVPDADKPKVITAILPKTTKGKDFLTGATAESTFTYGEYYLPVQNVSKVNTSYAVTTKVYDYYNNPTGVGSDYYIGRVKSKTETVQAYGDTKSGKEEFTYDSNNLKTIKKWNRDNTAYILNTFNYDGFGNVTQKVTSNSLDSGTETTASLYDGNGRFIVKTTDNLGLESSFTYNIWGQVLTQTDPIGNTVTNTYDNWGKLLSSGSNYEGTITYTYEKDSNSNITVTKSNPNGDLSKSFTNKLGQEYKVTTKAFGQGQFVSKETQFDILGRKVNESEPYFEGQSPSQWNNIVYDDSVFPAKITATAFNGKQTETVVSGLTTTVKEINGNVRTYTKTADALGNTISSTDKGGTITYSYNAAGEQIQAKYEENSVTTGYDSWGRKSQFNDPSNGLYKYEYNGLGQPKKIISPKGTKEYTYNNLGQLISQTELSSDGISTNKTIAFTYDTKGRLTTKSGTSNGKPYSLTLEFDTYGRIKAKTENSNGRTYTEKGFFYDAQSRVTSYTKSLLSSGITTEVTIVHKYNDWNGDLYQLRDKKTDVVLWELQSTNAKGQALTSKLGAVSINNAYDNNGFLTGINHSSVVKPDLLKVSYSFDALKNELINRKTEGDFLIVENFVYDDNNRLISWTNPRTGQNSTNAYDAKGRIVENDQVGIIKYDNTSKLYQPTSMSLNPNGVENYNNDLIQQINYNENNDPIFINGLKGDVNFEYGLTSMRQRVSYGGNFEPNKTGRYTKLYSEDGSFEVTTDNELKIERHILYIGGTPYDSNIIYVKNYKDTSGSYKFLHKDYLGSILAVSDAGGNKLEQRHFDAWGNLTHFQRGTGAVLTNKIDIESNIGKYGLILDRGYTSHEHFFEVGIIHMNGRLYDPLLRRFLNADENIQDPANTQNYNKYGYVMNNPMMYNDPNGEFWWFAAGALVGGYLSGVSANGGQWNPTKWDWQNTWSAVVGGAIGGAAISGALGNITSNPGAIKTVLPGIVSGGLNSAFTGSNFLGGVIGGISYTSNIFGNNITSTDMDLAGYEYSISEMAVSDDNTLVGGTPAEFSVSTVMNIDKTRYRRQFIRGAYHIVDNSGDLSPYLLGQGYSYGGNNDRLINGSGSEVWGVTEMVTHKGKVVWQRIYLPKGTFVSLEQLDLTIGHEIFHSILNNARLFDEEEITGTNKRVRIHEYYTSRWEEKYINFRGWQKLNLSTTLFNTEVSTFKSFERLQPKIKPIFNNYLKSTLK